MAASSSSSSSSSGQKKSKKSKKDKKDKKKDKKEKKGKKGKKAADKKEKRAEAWDCDREEAVRLTTQLLSLEDGIADELQGVFESLDGGDTVKIDGLQDKQAKKKLRHLLKALRLTEVDGGFKTASKKVSFAALFRGVLSDARKCVKAPKAEFAKQAAAAAAAAEAAAAKYCAAPAADAAAAAGSSGEEPEAASPAAPAEPAPAAPRKVGPQLPGASVGPAAPDEEQSSDDDAGGAGPRLAGEERKGVDLDSMPRMANREEWMTTPHASIAGAFADGGGAQRADKFGVTRSKKEQEAFEKAYKARGPSLLQEQAEGKFADHAEEIENMRKRKHTATDLWGLTSREQAREGTGGFSRKEFDPEKDMVSTKPMGQADFSQLVENSISGLNGRFSRGNIATSFL